MNNAVIAVLCPPLKDPSYRIDCETAFRTISDEGELALLRGLFTVAERNHRRGKFAAVNFGVFHGNGTGGAVNLKNGDHDPMIRRLRGNKAIQRLATFGSGELGCITPLETSSSLPPRRSCLSILVPGCLR